MATLNPRISVTVKPSVDAVLGGLSSITGESKSSIIASLLEESMPIFERMLQVLSAANQAKLALKEKSAQNLADAEAALGEQLGLSMDIFDQAMLPILKEAERINRRKKATEAGAPVTRASGARERPVQRSRPPYVTRGSGIPNTKKMPSPEQVRSSASPLTPKQPLKPIKRASKALNKKVRG